MRTSYLSMLTDSQLDVFLSCIVEATRLLSLDDNLAKNLADEDFINLMHVKVRAFNEIQRRAKLTI